MRLHTPHDWSIQKRTLRGGLRDGVDLIEVHNGALSYSIIPTRGMGLWRGEYRGNFLGWRAPVLGPVHPKYVNLNDRGGLGWLAGFDELLCRCGLSSLGPPGIDEGATSPVESQLTLHGRIANTPAHTVEAVLFGDDSDPPEITPDEAAVLVEVIKDLFYQSYVRTAKLRAAMRMRRFFAGESTNVTPIARSGGLRELA